MPENVKCRCPWLDITKPDYVKYHDDEWGVPVRDDQKLFEYLTLESAQAGLSWYTILIRREGYKGAFNQFNIKEVAQFTTDKVNELLLNDKIIRHRGKIEATINNAKCFMLIQKEFDSFSHYLWGFVNNETVVNNRSKKEDYPATSPLSDLLSKDLKKRGFKFLGSTTCYAFIQACGLVNDHSIDCYKRSQIINEYQQG